MRLDRWAARSTGNASLGVVAADGLGWVEHGADQRGGGGNAGDAEPDPGQHCAQRASRRVDGFQRATADQQLASVCDAQLPVPCRGWLGSPVRQRYSRQALADRPPQRQLPAVLRSRQRACRRLRDQWPANGLSQLCVSSGFRTTGAFRPAQDLHDQHGDCRQLVGQDEACSTARFPSITTMSWPSGASMPAIRPRFGPNSRREILRIAQYQIDHNADQLMFDPNARPGDDGYGTMYIGTGDGGNWPAQPDPLDQAQNPGRALGKILRIDPLASGGQAYGSRPTILFAGGPVAGRDLGAGPAAPAKPELRSRRQRRHARHRHRP